MWITNAGRPLLESDGDVLIDFSGSLAIGRLKEDGQIITYTEWDDERKEYVRKETTADNISRYRLLYDTVYPKIQTIFKRDEKTGHIIDGDWTYPEFKELKDFKWDATEKIDGMNTRIQYYPKLRKIEFLGRNQNSRIPTLLQEFLTSTFTVAGLSSIFPKSNLVVLYGEGYGDGILKNGKRYFKEGNKYILFDVNIDGWWMSHDFCHKTAKKLGIESVPNLGKMTIDETINKVKAGFTSQISEDKELPAEGIVLRTPDNIRRRNGERLMCKIKHKDFKWLK